MTKAHDGKQGLFLTVDCVETNIFLKDVEVKQYLLIWGRGSIFLQQHTQNSLITTPLLIVNKASNRTTKKFIFWKKLQI